MTAPRQHRPLRTGHLLPGLAAVLLLAAACDGPPRDIETVTATTGPIHESFREPARTRLAQTYTITMPVDGRIRRISLEPGDTVREGQELVGIDRVPLERAVDEAAARVAELASAIAQVRDTSVETAELAETEAQDREAIAAVEQTEAALEAAEARAGNADRNVDRLRRLQETSPGDVSERDLDNARTAAEVARHELGQARANLNAAQAREARARLAVATVRARMEAKKLYQSVLEQQHNQATARLAAARHTLGLASITSPIDGQVLERYTRGDRPAGAGEQLLLIGNLDDLEVVAEVLTQDALRLSQGSRVALEPASGMAEIGGRVARIEPQGFTKYSSLGVEQQRVNVIVHLDAHPAEIGVGYQLQARFYTGEKAEALIVPRYSVLQAPDRSWYAFRVNGKSLERVAVTLGLRSDLRLEITDGLAAGDRIVAAPDTTLSDGERVNVTGERPVPDGESAPPGAAQEALPIDNSPD